jgi:hypothetical protein
MPICAGRGQEESAPVPEIDLTALLAGAELLPDSPARLRPVAEVLAALRAEPAGDELAGEQAVLSRFRQQAGVSVLQRRSRRRRPVMLIATLAATAAATLAVIGLSLGAYTDGLPGPMQRIAHDAIGAPAAGTEQSVRASPIPVPSSTPAGPGGAGPPGSPRGAMGMLSQLCASYESLHGHAGGVGRSAAFHALIAAAGGVGKIPAFCARISHPGAPPPAVPPRHAPPPHPPHKKEPHPNANGNGDSQGGGGGNSQGNSQGNPLGAGNGNSQGNGKGNENAQGHGVPDSRWVRRLAP